MARRCGRCGASKPVCEFTWNTKANKFDSYCRLCRADYKQEHYAQNKQRYIDKAAARNRRVREDRTRFILDFFKHNPCADCGELDPIVLEFDHTGEKKFNVSAGIRDRNWQTVLDEMAKCEVVCANCHRRRTARRGGFARTRFTLE
jgi:hypothetical protein